MRAHTCPLRRAAVLVLRGGHALVVALSTHLFSMRKLGCVLAFQDHTPVAMPDVSPDVRAGMVDAGFTTANDSSPSAAAPAPPFAAKVTTTTDPATGASIPFSFARRSPPSPHHVATSAALCSSSFTAAVGTAAGTVHLFSLTCHDDGSLHATHTVRLSLQQWDFRHPQVGAASVLQWSPSGGALAVGHSVRGVCAWSRSGCRLWSTLPEAGSSVPVSSRVPEVASGGVQAMAWTNKGWKLMIVPAADGSGGSGGGATGGTGATLAASLSRPSNLVCVNTIRPLTNGPTALPGVTGCLSHFTPLLLTSTGTRVLGTANQPAMTLAWSHVRPLPTYLSANWPLHGAALSDDGRSLVVVGRRGMAVLVTRSGRWRVFGDVVHEMEARCHLIGWLGYKCVCVRVRACACECL